MTFDILAFQNLFVRELKLQSFDSEIQLGQTPGWDSLSHFNLIVAIEADYPITFTAKEISELKTYKDLLACVTQKLKT
jgi:acyl carrier protein